MFLGIDLGTSSVKVMLLDPQGHAASAARAPYAVHAPQEGWAQSDPADWESATGLAIGQLPAALRASVRAIGFSGQMHGVVLTGADGEALGPAVLWLDTRARSYLADFPADTLVRTGNAPGAGMAGASLCWLRDHDAAAYARARWALQPKDWLRMRLGGSAHTDPSDASGTLLADREGDWSGIQCEALGLRPDLLAPVADACGLAGVLRPDLARAWGLPSGTPLVVGAADTAAAALGTGLLQDGEAQLTLGSGGQIIVMRAQCPPPVAALNNFRSASPAGFARWYVMAAMQNVGIALDWARGILGMSWDEAYACLQQPPRTSALFLPHLSGERTPLMDPQARAAWIGLSVGDDRRSLMYAAFEGVAFSVRAGFEALNRSLGADPVRELRLAGGGSTQAQWRGLLCDVLGVPLRCVQTENASARGACLLAGLAVNHWVAEDMRALGNAVASICLPTPRADLEARYRSFGQAVKRLRQSGSGSVD